MTGLATTVDVGAGTIDELVSTVLAVDADADGAQLRAAYALAAERHAAQVRKSGEPYITHPLAVAFICADLRADATAIVAALLHDTVEDTETTLDEITAQFGNDVSLIVDGVTKLAHFRYSSREEARAENYRRMILATARDVRVLVVKLADRVHNMRTIGSLRREKQVEIARETLELYAPIAHRLGIHRVKSELEDLAFATLHPRRFEDLERLVADDRSSRDGAVAESIRVLAVELERNGISADLSGRSKHLYSIFEKMRRQGKGFGEIFDLSAVRIIARNDEDCYRAFGVAHHLWTPVPGRFKDYISAPKANGYQSLHTTVIGPNGRPIEIQIRTAQMNDVAEFGLAAHWRYKGAKRSHAALFEELTNAAMDADSGEFQRTLETGLLENREIFVFTPRGELRTLPFGATPLDFAYAVHTEVGHRCVGARVNGALVSLAAPLESGNVVEIITSKVERGPSRDWLGIVRTARARNRIRTFLARERREDDELKGRDLLQQALRAAKVPHQKVLGSPLFRDVITDAGYRRADDFYLAVGTRRIEARDIVGELLRRLKTDTVAEETAVALVERPTKAPTQSGRYYGVVVDGVAEGADVLVRMARCCSPVPGDEIIGYISLGRGITVHRSDCTNARSLARTPERVTSVSWEGSPTATFRTWLAVDASDRPRLLEDIGRTFGEHGCNVVEYSGSTSDGMARNRYAVEIGDVKTLRSVLSALRAIDSVWDAYRITPRTAA